MNEDKEYTEDEVRLVLLKERVNKLIEENTELQLTIIRNNANYSATVKHLQSKIEELTKDEPIQEEYPDLPHGDN